MFTLVPAFSGPWVVTSNKMKPEYMWWREEGLVRHNAILVSYGLRLLMEDRLGYFNNIADMLNYDLSKVIAIADSGGFEIQTRNITFNVEEVLEWQFRNANIVIGLDMPPRGMTKVEEVKDWENCKKFTRKNIEKMVRYASSRKAENRKIYGVMHGLSLAELNDWYEYVVKDFMPSLDGLSYAVRPPNNPNSVMLALAHAKSLGVENLHLLGVTGKRTMIPIVWYSDNFKLLTSDSSSFTKQGGRGRMFSPVFMIAHPVGKRGRKDGVDFDKFECHCPACRYAKEKHVTSITHLHNVDAYYLASLHNLFWLLSYVDGLKWIKEYSPSEYKSHAVLKNVFLDWLECVDEKGLEWCYLYHKNKRGENTMAELESKSTIKMKKEVRKTWW